MGDCSDTFDLFDISFQEAVMVSKFGCFFLLKNTGFIMTPIDLQFLERISLDYGNDFIVVAFWCDWSD